MEPIEGGADAAESSPPKPSSPDATAVADKDEHDVEARSPTRELGAPLSSGSLQSVQSTDQVLEMTNRLDLSDSSAILSRLSKRGGPSAPEPLNSSSRSRRSSSKISLKSSRRLSRRPSMHETHDSEPLRRGEFLYYLYSFAILGTSARVFLSRFFGQDCESPGKVEDFLSPLTERICVTSGGTTDQHGGALFLDLPANMLGSFIMGLVSSLHPEGGRRGSKLPWLHRDHPLQNHEGIHHAIKVGFCGSLTTFSSWNSQMVTMLDGTDTVLGPQVIPALFGYMIGLACAVWAFVLGGRVHEWLYDWSNGIKDREVEPQHPQSGPSVGNVVEHDEDDEEQPTSWDTEESNPRYRHSASSFEGSTASAKLEVLEPPAVPPRRLSASSISVPRRSPRATSLTICLHKVVPFLISISLLVAYGCGVGVHNIQFYRELFACSILTPIGVHLRWKLATLNGNGIGANHRYEWVPWGTLSGNLSAVAISVIFQALNMQYSHRGRGDHPYVLALIVGMKTGVAGSLSTVSSFAKEVVNLATIHPTHAKAYIYASATILISMFFGMAIYAPMIRYG